MTALFLFLKGKQYIAWIAVIALILAAGGYWHHTTYENGIKAQQTIDAFNTAKLIAQADAQTLQAQKRADHAELNYATEHSTLENYMAAHVVTIGKLCDNEPITVKSVSRSASQDSGNGAGPSPTAVVRDVSTADNGQSYDRSKLLTALAALADEQTAVIREFQQRE